MRKNKRSSYEQCDHAQAVVDADDSQLVLVARISQCANDSRELVTLAYNTKRLWNMRMAQA